MITREIPADFAQHYREPAEVLKARYSAGYTVISRWRQALGWTKEDAPRSPGPPLRFHRPDDFAEMQAGMTVRALEAHYNVSNMVITRWLRELGINRAAERKAAGEAARTAVATKDTRKPMVSTFTKTAAPDRPHIDPTRAGQAAEYLRHFGPVRRCDDRGHYDPAGKFWRRGTSSIPLTADEIIDRAIRNGWHDPFARIAA